MAANSSSSPTRENDAKALQFIEEMTQNADAVQENVLAEILTQNAETEYLKSFNLNGATDRETYKSKIPVITYEDIQPLIRRIADGDRSPILCAHPITEFHTSSGTSGGECKLMPTTKVAMNRGQLFRSFLTPIINKHVKGLDKGKTLYFYFVKAEKKTKGGLLARTALTSYYKSEHFTARPHDPYNVYTSPNEAILCEDSFQSMYTQMLCGLYDRQHVLRIGAIFATGLLRAITFLQLNWKQLTHDIHTGSLNTKITDVPLRSCMSRIIRPEPALAEFIAHECAKDNWERIIVRIWPNTKYLDVIVTGAMTQYIPSLDYYSGGLPKASMIYAATECYFGPNLNPMVDPYQVSYTIMPNMAYFEFLPHESDSSQLVDLTRVKIGKEYELVITTYSGLYRYQVGDILRVTGFYNSAPQFQFVRRKNVILSIDADKTDEVELQRAIDKASQLLKEFNTSVVDYTSYADVKTIPGHYVIYLELHLANSVCDEVMEQCCLAMEESLSSVYRYYRVVDNSIGPLEIRVVKNGTFEEIMDYVISRGGSIAQYKVSRCVCLKSVLDILHSWVNSAHFSPLLPCWTQSGI